MDAHNNQFGVRGAYFEFPFHPFRCRELQAALVEATEQLEKAQMSIEGLSQTNAKVVELSQVKHDTGNQ